MGDPPGTASAQMVGAMNDDDGYFSERIAALYDDYEGREEFAAEDIEPAGVGQQIGFAADRGEGAQRFGVALHDVVAAADERSDANARAIRPPAQNCEVGRGAADSNHQPE